MNRRGFLLGALAAPIAAKLAPLAAEQLSFQGVPIVADSALTMAELQAVTLRAFIPRLIVQIYRPSAILAHMTPPGPFSV